MTRMISSSDLPASLLCLALALPWISPSASADEWPGWRGERRDGVWRETGILRKFPGGGPEVKWRAPIGPGFSGPSVALGRVYATDRDRERGLERVLSYDARDGKRLWVHEYPARYHGVDYDSGPRASPTVVNGRVYTLGTMGHLRALDAASGDLLWSKDLEREYAARVPGWGIAGAPLAEGRLLIVNAGGEKGACLLAFDLESGAEVWRALKDPPGYSAPIAIDSGGARQIIFWSARSVSSLEPLTGKLYWQETFRSNMDMSVATPMLHGDVLFVSSFYSGALALRLDPSRPAAVPLYRSQKDSEMETDLVHCLISTPCFRGEHLYAVDSYGQLRCLEVATGKRVWETLAATGKARWSNAHLIPNGEVTFLFNEHGELIIADLSPAGYREIDRTKLIEPTLEVQKTRKVVWAHPAFAGRSVFARNDREILCASLSARDTDPGPASGPKASGAWIRPSWPDGKEPRFPERRLAWFQLPNLAVTYLKEITVKDGLFLAMARIETPAHAFILIDGREVFSHPELWQEGKPVAGGSHDVDLTEFLPPGRHAILVGAPSPGFALSGFLEYEDGSRGPLITDGTWRAKKFPPGICHEFESHAKPGFDDSTWLAVSADGERSLEAPAEALLVAFLPSELSRLGRRIEDAQWRLDLIVRRGTSVLDGETYYGGGREFVHPEAVAAAARGLGKVPSTRQGLKELLESGEKRAAARPAAPALDRGALKALRSRVSDLEGAAEASSRLLYLDHEVRNLRNALRILEGLGLSVSAKDTDSFAERIEALGGLLEKDSLEKALAASQDLRKAAVELRSRLEKLWGHPLSRYSESRFSKLGWTHDTSLVDGELEDWGIRIEALKAPAAVKAPGSWRFQLDPENSGLDAGWHTMGFNIEGQWPSIKVPGTWEEKHKQPNPKFPGDNPYPGKAEASSAGPYNGYAWYRAHLRVPEEWRGHDLDLSIGWANDFDWVYFNDRLIGKTGPEIAGWTKAARHYTIPGDQVKYGDENLVAIKVYDLGGEGGLGPVEIKNPTVAARTEEGPRTRVLRSPCSPGILLQATGKEIVLWGAKDGGRSPALALPIEKGPEVRRPGSFAALYRSSEDGPLSRNWALLWTGFKGSSDERPIEVVLEREPESIFSRLSGEVAEVRIAFREPGARAVLIRPFRLSLPEDGRGIPASEKERAGLWSDLLLDYPTGYTELARRSPEKADRMEVFTAYDMESLRNGWSSKGADPRPIIPVPVLLAFALKKGWTDTAADMPLTDTRYELGERGSFLVARGSPHLRYHYPLDPIPRLGGFTSWVFMPWDAGVDGNDREAEAVAQTGANSYRPQHNFAGEKPRIFAEFCRKHGLNYLNNPDNVLGDAAWDKEKKLPRTEVWLDHYRKLTGEFKDRGEYEVGFDLINEAANMKAAVYNPLIKLLTEEIRKVDARHLLFVETCQSWGAVEEFPALAPTGDPRTIYSFHDYNFRLRGPDRWPEADRDIRSIYKKWKPAFDFMVRHQAPISIGEFGGFEQGGEHSPHAETLLLDQFRIFDQFGMHFHYYPGRGILWPRSDGSLRPNRVALAFRRYFSLGTFNRHFPGFQPARPSKTGE